MSDFGDGTDNDVHMVMDEQESKISNDDIIQFVRNVKTFCEELEPLKSKKLRTARQKFEMQNKKVLSAVQFPDRDEDDNGDDIMDFPIQGPKKKPIDQQKMEEVRRTILASYKINDQKVQMNHPPQDVADIVVAIENLCSTMKKKRKKLLGQYFELGRLLQVLKETCSQKKKKDGGKKIEYFRKLIEESDIDHDVPYCNFLIRFFVAVSGRNEELLNSTLPISYMKDNLKYIKPLCMQDAFASF